MYCNCVTMMNQIPFSCGCARVWFHAVLRNKMCAYCVCLQTSTIPGLKWVFHSSEPQMAERVHSDKTVFLWKRGAAWLSVSSVSVWVSQCTIQQYYWTHTKTLWVPSTAETYKHSEFLIVAAPRPVTARLQPNIMSSSTNKAKGRHNSPLWWFPFLKCENLQLFL